MTDDVAIDAERCLRILIEDQDRWAPEIELHTVGGMLVAVERERNEP